MEKITYLIGAGASAGTIPIITEFSSGIKILSDAMLKFRMQITNSFPPDQQQIITDSFEQFLKDCESFEDGSIERKSVDKFAKQLYIQNRKSEFERLKIIISLVVIYHTHFKKMDSRYDTFFQNIIERANEFNNDYRIISWNYDYLFEKAYSLYSMEPSLKKNQDLLYINGNGLAGTQKIGSFKLFKINGTTAFYHAAGSKEVNLNDLMDSQDNLQLLISFMDFYYKSTLENQVYKCQISFAFERKFSEDEDHIIKKAIKEIEGSKAIILIGYSLPNVNKDVDRELLKAVFATSKVYIQSKEPLQTTIDKWIDLYPNYYPAMFFQKDIESFYVPTWRSDMFS